jgi:hypothetical protein
MENNYIVENENKLEFPKIPKYSESMLEGKKLLKKKENARGIIEIQMEQNFQWLKLY